MPKRPLSSARSNPTTSSGALSRRGLFAATAIGLPATALLGTVAPAAADPSVPDGETRIVDLPLADAALVDADGVQVRDLPEQPATMIGVTWATGSPEPAVAARGLLEDGSWTPWFDLETALDPETGQGTAGTELAWLGVVTALQVRAEIDGAEAGAGVTAHVVTTSHHTADDLVGQFSGPLAGQQVQGRSAPSLGGADEAQLSQQAQQSRASAAMPLATAAAAPRNPATPPLASGAPAFVTRRSWGADEGATRGTSAADALKSVVVHHTAGTNNYSASQSAQIVRGIHTYHTRTLGWADIGYNILVDKYGRIFEGRAGGLHRNIVGAHALGFNTGSFGISVLGDYTSTTVPAAARDAVARIAGWKLHSTFHDSAKGSESWKVTTSGTRFSVGSTRSLPRIMGHRDVNYTSCPGARLYGDLGGIRDEAQRVMDRGWQHHRVAYDRAGGEAKLGTVVRSAHATGGYWATILSKGLVLHQGDGAATAYVSDMAKQWEASWGRPVRNPSQDGDRRIQPFQNGTAALEGGKVRFVTPSFKDVAPARVFFLEIEDLAARGITRGWGDGTFRPDNDNLRDAMIVFIYRAMGSPKYTAPRTSPFRDVSTDFVFYKELCWAYEEGIGRGWDDGRFRPLVPVKRDAVAAFLYRAAGSPAASKNDARRFTDVPTNHIFAKEIGWLAKTGISRGWDDGTFRPDAHIKRDQMATFVMRWMTLTGRA